MPPGYRRRGDWLVTDEAASAAEAEVESWSPGRRARDRLSRAPIETDYETWRENSRGLDFPGVDTPTEAPRESLLDAHREATRGGQGRDAVFDPEHDTSWSGETLARSVEESGRYPSDLGVTLRDAFRP